MMLGHKGQVSFVQSKVLSLLDIGGVLHEEGYFRL